MKKNSKKKENPAIAKLRRENEELREWKRRLSLLLNFAKKISVQKEVNSLLHLLVDVARNVLNAERATVFLLDKNKKELWSRVASGDPIIRVPSNKGIVGEAVKKRMVINISNAYKDPRFNQEVDKNTGFKTKNLLTAPMHNIRGEVIGAFQVLNKKNGPFKTDDKKILLIFADQAATAVENAQLNEEIRTAAQDTILRLASAAEYKDRDTRNHLERMSRYSAVIAEEMGMPREWAQNLQMASPMHDIGKLGVPDSILQKPGKLEDKEWQEMRKHPLYGAEILKGSKNELIQMSARIAKSHHEKWDGNGYPEGLKRNDIPLEGRIVAVADVFDALTSRRCYKPAFSMKETIRIIDEGSGKHFDPKVVLAFHKALPRLLVIMENYADSPAEVVEETPKDSPLTKYKKVHS